MMECKRCQVEMVSGKAFQNTLVGFPDFIGDTGLERGCTVSRSGPAKLVEVWKCPECGRSVSK